MTGMLIGYARVSTSEQDLTAQVAALKELGVVPERIYVDHGLSGTTRARPCLEKAMAACPPGDTLVVTKLDRLARSLPDARDIAAELLAAGVRLSLGGTVHHPTDPIGRLLFNVLAMVAEFEADLLRARTKEGMQLARERSRLRGRKPKLPRARKAPGRTARGRRAHRGGAVRTIRHRARHGLPRSRSQRRSKAGGMSVAAPPPAAFGLREATWKDAIRAQWWFLRNLPRRADMLLAVDLFLVFGTIFAVLAWTRGAGPIEVIAYVAGVPLVTFCVLPPMAGALTWLWYIHSPSRVVYLDDNAALVLRQKTVRGQLVWTIGDHIARTIGSGQGAALRGRLSPGLAAAADAAQAPIRGRAAHPKLRDRYVAQFRGWHLRPEPGSKVNVIRDPQ